jgi:hypothetical protein
METLFRIIQSRKIQLYISFFVYVAARRFACLKLSSRLLEIRDSRLEIRDSRFEIRVICWGIDLSDKCYQSGDVRFWCSIGLLSTDLLVKLSEDLLRK